MAAVGEETTKVTERNGIVYRAGSGDIMAENTREIVLDILLSLEKGEEFSNKLLKAVLDKYDYLEVREKAFIKRVTEGTIERRLELDYYLNHFSSVPVNKMKPLIRCLLRMSSYQILYMDAVPDSAACNEACKLAGKRKFQNLKGFVNGVLRKIAAQKGNLPMPDKNQSPKEYFSVKYSCPEWLVEMWLDEYGEEITEEILNGLLRVHPVSLRFATTLSWEERQKVVEQIQESGVGMQQSSYLPYVYEADNAEGIGTLPGFWEGAFTVQDVSSALAVEAAGICPGDFVMDICAAPGGKTILAAERADSVLARDVSEYKISLITENLERMGRGNVTTKVYDATVFDEAYKEKADVLLVDAPCSGLGVMGKKRDIKYHITPEGMESIMMLQKEILNSSWQYVKPGGVLLYSTCTIHRGENEEMVRWITDNLPFEPEDIAPYMPEKLIADKEKIPAHKDTFLNEKEAAACMQLLPGYMEADGFFFARFRRRAEGMKEG